MEIENKKSSEILLESKEDIDEFIKNEVTQTDRFVVDFSGYGN